METSNAAVAQVRLRAVPLALRAGQTVCVVVLHAVQLVRVLESYPSADARRTDFDKWLLDARRALGSAATSSGSSPGLQLACRVASGDDSVFRDAQFEPLYVFSACLDR